MQASRVHFTLLQSAQPMHNSFQAPPDATIVIGAGVAGLLCAHLLEQQGRSVLLLESRARIGGRVRSDAAHTAQPAVDMGPSWLWPELNDRLHHWCETLGLSLFAQHQSGAALLERPNQPVQRYDASFDQQPASQRMVGGMAALTQALLGRLTRTELRLDTRVHTIHHEAGATLLAQATSGVDPVTASVSAYAPTAATATARGTVHPGSSRVRVVAHTPAGEMQHVGAHVVLALPARLLGEQMRWEPALPAAITQAWARTPTWMAGQAKFVATYPSAFWREVGLSGDASSQLGPLVEMHDASSPDAACAALFGFVGVPAQWRRSLGKEALTQACVEQLTRLFGPQAGQPSWVCLKDWAQDANTATPADAAGAQGHPSQPPRQLPAPWDGVAWLAGSEFADTFTGYLEGAVRSAETVAAEMDARTNTAGTT
jgi:monoamine oxidase